MQGVILCGGQSSRMGKDKGLLMLHLMNWAQTAAAKMNSLGLPALVSVNEQQYAGYASIFPAAQLVKDNTSLQMKGPLLGILSVHQSYPLEDLFILACDMPLMETALMQSLLTHYLQHPAGACVFAHGDGYEPLCGIYSAQGIAAINDLQMNGQLNKHSMKFVLESIQTATLVITPEQKTCFQNFNTPSQLNGL